MVQQVRLLGVFLALLAIMLLACKKDESTQPQSAAKMPGVSMVASNDFIQAKDFDSLQTINAKWVALIPFALGYWDSSALVYNHPNQWKGESLEGMEHAINLANQKGLKVMLKPQIWFWGGHFTGHFSLRTEANWRRFEANYTNYILDYANLAEKMKVPLFCIGTELGFFIERRPHVWDKLIDDVREVYSGKLVYAANWDSYKKVRFWSKIDFIGIDAYFPVSEELTPTVETCEVSWRRIKKDLKEHAARNQRPILFTEYGYCSIDFAGKEPWNPPNTGDINMEAQVNAYKALYESVWNEPWFAGGFLWKWYENDGNAGGATHKRFTPQNKPVEKVIAEFYGKR